MHSEALAAAEIPSYEMNAQEGVHHKRLGTLCQKPGTTMYAEYSKQAGCQTKYFSIHALIQRHVPLKQCPFVLS